MDIDMKLKQSNIFLLNKTACIIDNGYLYEIAAHKMGLTKITTLL